jgi:hypothetical protein
MLVLLRLPCVVHRQEGQCIGEFGSGYSNANYWWVGSDDDGCRQGVSLSATGEGGVLSLTVTAVALGCSQDVNLLRA